MMSIHVGDRVFFFDNKQPLPSEGMGTVLEVSTKKGILVLLSDITGNIITQLIDDCMKMGNWETVEEDSK